MISKEEFRRLKPKEINAYEREPFEEVRPRLERFLPNFPICVLEQWAYRHSEQFDQDYWWLGFDGLTFNLESWANSEIMRLIGSKMLDTQDYWGDELVIRKDKMRSSTWLAQYFLTYKTWPKPIIILRNSLALKNPDGHSLAEPYHLLEGHMRLAYLRAHIRHKIEGTPKSHGVWVADCDPENISDLW